jgi:hypothetical protein
LIAVVIKKKLNGKALKLDGKARKDCCCDCPCGIPPVLSETLHVVLSNKTGGAECLPDEFDLIWDGEEWIFLMTLDSDPPHTCTVGDLTWQMACGVGYYKIEIGCFTGEHVFFSVSVDCDPFQVVFETGTIGATGSCIDGTQDSSFTITVTEGP